jgi:anti-sigma regulatory factor (Ser/Thr protein kinase)
MDALLIEEWLGGESASAIEVLDAASVSLVRVRVRELGAALGLSDTVTGSVVNVASELAHNQLAHARRGHMLVRCIARDGTPGLELIAADLGPGIADPAEALRGAPRPAASDPALKRSLGVGLSAVLELADETDFDVRVGEGSCVWARKFAAPVRRRRELGIYGRPYPGELLSGDHAGFVRGEDELLLALCDGLGHGHFARMASDAALTSVREQHKHQSPAALLAAAHTALRETRGGVMAIALVSEPSGMAEIASVGNVAARLGGPQLSTSVLGSSSILGGRAPLLKPVRAVHGLGARDAIVLFSDGLGSRFDFQQEVLQSHGHPIVLAQHLLTEFTRKNDDALVLVAR